MWDWLQYILLGYTCGHLCSHKCIQHWFDWIRGDWLLTSTLWYFTHTVWINISTLSAWVEQFQRYLYFQFILMYLCLLEIFKLFVAVFQTKLKMYLIFSLVNFEAICVENDWHVSFIVKRRFILILSSISCINYLFWAIFYIYWKLVKVS